MTISLEASEWIRRFHPAPAAPVRLVCFPHAGGAASYYRPVSAALAPAVEVLVVQYPGRQDRYGEPAVDDLFVLADRLAGVLPAVMGGPVAFFGHSMGASLAFEVARRLEARGTRLHTLFVSGRRAPSGPLGDGVHLKNDDELLAEVKRLGGTEAAILDDPDIRRMALPALRSDYRAAERYHYRPGPDVSCPIVALLGDQDPKVDEAQASGWADRTSAGFELKTFPGGHFYLKDEAAAITGLIGDRLAR
ncbi:thioesterase [Amycolatopsis balhimycina DSM 5908]|uniref:Thioesterase n=1 Tax=Amycolatopsis balhimycina DSM 5908 TaxID=1081091 RepID=A0A428WQE4_AMYBA|nr:alpha/beta fold hydrolase [Amycolatopsis balhimycina]RSM45253.1 thioesterase [Amycolatopsis balhimycina DSM 5908]